ncbi:UDP-glucuronosyltransferase 2B15-like [Anoplophora glabripennis]|uniref:UDP-glucuronosyltransferase 2B15-like n=1 Tax=Anoplophora glabripennis TaxID=217634 RepID=UPI000874D428|nr:UDP-glucuronosyltransferase 2B15-like [Anoplophora glabripennis]
MSARIGFFSFLVLFLTIIGKNEGARILGVFPFFAPSHYILGSTLMKGLAEAGHDVTIISPFKEKNPPKGGKWTEIIVENTLEAVMKSFPKPDLFKMEGLSGISSGISTTFLIETLTNLITEETLKNNKIQELLKSNQKFDAVIITQFNVEAMKAFASHFNAHLILFSNVAANSWLNHFVGNPSLPSFFPEILLSFPEKMSFMQRLENTIFKLANTLYYNLYIYPKHNEFIQKYFPNPVNIDDLLYNVSLVLLNSHESISSAQPHVPCMVEIGGYHIQPPKKLPDDLQKFLDEAKEGVIYFSMGSNLKSQDLPIETREAILKAFGKRKEKILWKWEDDVLPGKPPNVKVGKWLPQQDILAHANVKLFITHGGLLSTIETVYHGVPIIAIPIGGDQKMNAYGAERQGYGIVLPLREISEEKLSGLLDEVLANPQYTNNVKERSIIMKDRQVKPMDNAVYWVEYVIRHNGAKHLRVPYLELTWYQFYLLDVLAFIIGVILTTVILIKVTCTYFYRKRLNKTKLKKN